MHMSVPPMDQVSSEARNPRDAKSKMDTELPRRDNPNTASEDPIRAQLLKDIDAPKWIKSKMDKDKSCFRPHKHNQLLIQ